MCQRVQGRHFRLGIREAVNISRNVCEKGLCEVRALSMPNPSVVYNLRCLLVLVKILVPTRVKIVKSKIRKTG